MVRRDLGVTMQRLGVLCSSFEDGPRMCTCRPFRNIAKLS